LFLADSFHPDDGGDTFLTRGTQHHIPEDGLLHVYNMQILMRHILPYKTGSESDKIYLQCNCPILPATLVMDTKFANHNKYHSTTYEE
jgi:hypothetical protein